MDTAAGEHATGRLTGHGHRLRLEFDRPEILTETTDRSMVTAVAAQLVSAHLRAELHGPRGRIAVVDPAHTSRVAALLTGSPHITVDRLGWALAARTVASTTVAAVAVGATVAARRRSRRNPPPSSVMTRRDADNRDADNREVDTVDTAAATGQVERARRLGVAV